MMRRVVVTGLGMMTPLACGVEATWQRLLAGESGIRRIAKFEVSDLPCRIAGEIPRGDGSNGTFNADDWMEPKERRKVDDFILYAMGAAKQALDDADWHPREYEDQIASGVLIGSGIGGIEGIAETAVQLKERGPRRISPFFIPGRIINLASGYVSIAHSLKGPESRGRHRLFDRRSRHRRRRQAGRARGRRRDGRWRHRIPGEPHLARRLRCLPGALDRIQRNARARLAALRPRSRRICHGRRRGHGNPRRVRTRETAWRPHLRRTRRLRPLRRRLSYYRARPGWRRRAALHESCTAPGRHFTGGYRLHQRSWHFNSARR